LVITASAVEVSIATAEGLVPGKLSEVSVIEDVDDAGGP
jgi:hypothetical protein